MQHPNWNAHFVAAPPQLHSALPLPYSALVHHLQEQIPMPKPNRQNNFVHLLAPNETAGVPFSGHSNMTLMQALQAHSIPHHFGRGRGRGRGGARGVARGRGARGRGARGRGKAAMHAPMIPGGQLSPPSSEFDAEFQTAIQQCTIEDLNFCAIAFAQFHSINVVPPFEHDNAQLSDLTSILFAQQNQRLGYKLSPQSLTDLSPSSTTNTEKILEAANQLIQAKGIQKPTGSALCHYQ